MIAQVPNLAWVTRQSSVGSSRRDTVSKRFCANVEWLKAGFTLYGCNASSCEMADVFIATGREPSEKARPDTHEMIAQVPNLAWVARQSSVDLG